jgi:hypothetical protein
MMGGGYGVVVDIILGILLLGILFVVVVGTIRRIGSTANTVFSQNS